MATSGTQLAFAIRAVNEASATLKAVQGDIHDVADKATKSQGPLGGMGSALGGVAKIAGGFVLGAGLLKAPGFLIGAAQAAADDEASQLKLQKAVENTGASYDAFSGQLDKSISTAQRRGFTDDEARNSLALLEAQTGDTEESMKRFALAQDLARGAGIPLEMSSKLLGKVTAENVEVFKKMGITIGEGASEADAFAAVQAKFGGQSETFANSTAGHFAAVKIQMGELKEKIGMVLLPVMAKIGQVLVEDVIPKVEEFIDVLKTKLAPIIRDDVKPVMDDIADRLKNDVAPAVKEVADKVIEFAGKKALIVGLGVAIATMFAGWAVMAGIAAVSTALAFAPFIAAVAVVALVATGLVVLEEKTGLVSAAFDVVKKAGKDVWEVVGPLLADALETLKQGWEDLQPAIETVGAFLKDTVLPIFEKVGKFLIDHPILLAVLGVAIAAIVAPWLLVIAAVILVLAKWDAIKTLFTVTIPEAIGSVIAKINELPIIGAVAEAVFSFIHNRVDFFMQAIKDVIDVVMGLVTGDWDRVWQGLKSLALAPLELLKSDVGTVLNLMKGVITDTLSGVAGLISKPFTDGLDAVKGLGSQAVEVGRGIISAISGGVKDAINNVLISGLESGLNRVLRGIALGIRVIKKLTDALPGGNPLGNTLQAAIDGLQQGISIPRLARGGLLTEPTLFIGGDAGTRNPEIVSPVALMRQVVREESGGGLDQRGFVQALREALQGMSWRMDMDGVVRLVSEFQGRQADLYARAG